VASRPSSTSGTTRGDGREPVVARVVTLTTRERALAPPANDNLRPSSRQIAQIAGPAAILALMAIGGIYLYLS